MPALYKCFVLSGLLFVGSWQSSSVAADDYLLRTFARQRLSDVYLSEGISAGDINGDRIADVVYGPYWFAGPKFQRKQEIYPAVPQDRNGYADNFFSWTYDVNLDGWRDVLVVGFPGTPAYVYENPGSEVGWDSHWKKHQVFDWVSNESPQWVDIVGDERPELVCTRDGFFGFVTINTQDPFGSWRFHPVSEQVTAKRFGHGLGVGDVNGDGRMDILHAGGWYEQPAGEATTRRWRSHGVSFSSSYGGAEMYAYDVDGDGDSDIITSNAAHDFGLGWYEQHDEQGEAAFRYHPIMGAHPAENPYGLVISELHSVKLADVDGDGLQDIVTGKTYWSHHRQSPMWDAGAVVYWFKLQRNEDGVQWIPYQADGEAGIGRQVSVADLNSDGKLDIVVGGMKGAHVLSQQVADVSRDVWQAAQPKPYAGKPAPVLDDASSRRGPRSPIESTSGRVVSAIEAELLAVRVSGGKAQPQPMGDFQADRWSGDSQLWWNGARPSDTMTVDLPSFRGTVDLEIVLTCAVDYAVVQLSLDGKPLGEVIDLYEGKVVTTGVLSYPNIATEGTQHTLAIEIVGANSKAKKAWMVGVDYLRIKRADGSFVLAVSGQGKAATAKDQYVAKTATGEELQLGFEHGTLDDWTAEGDAFRDQPIQGDTVRKRRNDMRSAHVGEYWIGGYERGGDAGTGTLTSQPFVVSHPFASFLSNGGSTKDTRVELIRHDSRDVVFSISGEDSETMRQVVVDLRPHVGKEIFIRLVDDSKVAWGHLNFDDFQFHAKPPRPVSVPDIVLTDDQYPHAGLSASKAAAAMKVPDGFSVTVGAAEPAVQQPIAMAIDDRGRVWIAEAYEYPNRADGDAGRDRILIFEDTDNDGTLDHRKVFYEGLNLVSGLEVGFGGVWVGAAPYLMFIPDRDGDDQADGKPQILLDGWGYQDTHETLNAFIWGPDGWLYGCHGVFTHSRVGKPGTPDDQRSPVNAAVWRYHPTKHQFEVFAHGTSNPWGVDFNDHGQAFITACVIPHLYHIIHGARYQRQGGQHFNPHTYQDIVTIADHLHYLGSTPHGGNSKSDAAGGGHAHAGAMIYLGDRWPAKYRNQLFMNNIHGQRLNVDILRPNGSGYVGEHGPDFLLTGDQASQILNLRYGPDGNAWMIDWYDMQACHRRESTLHDRSNGRIYKISYGQAEESNVKPFIQMSDRELAELSLHQNDWYVRHARRVLQERAAAQGIADDAVLALKRIATSHADDTRRLRAAWGLHVTGNLTAQISMQLLSDASPYVRGWTVQLAMEAAGNQPDETWVERFEQMAREDRSPVVRLYLASAAQLLPLDQRWQLVENVARHTGDLSDHNLPLMIWYAAEPLAEVDAPRAIQLALRVGDTMPLVREFMVRRVAGLGDDASLNALVESLGLMQDANIQRTVLEAIRTALEGRRHVHPPKAWDRVGQALLAVEDDRVRLQATALGVTFGDKTAMQRMRSSVNDVSQSSEQRRLSLQSLIDVNDPQLVETLLTLLDQDSSVADDAIRGLAQYDDPRIASTLLAKYADLTVERKQLALGTLTARTASAAALLDAIVDEALPAADLTADIVRQIQAMNQPELNDRLASVWGTVRESDADKREIMQRYRSLVTADSDVGVDLELGRTLFAKTCMKCHVLYGIGNQIGPDLTGSNRANLDYLLSNIVDPSAVMAKEYQPTTIVTDDGRIVLGLVKREDQNAITLQTSDSIVVVPLDEIAERVQSDKSMMPDDQLKLFSQHELRSLIGYLRHSSQTPMLATSENAIKLFNGQDLTGWKGAEELWSVDNRQLVGRTNGLDHNEWLVSELAVEDFRLRVDVKLVGDEGNSGIQFRSQAGESGVSGYQADIGKGWWGKLYEEHGRGLLSEQSGERFVKPGEWNRYEIIVQGEHIRTAINDHTCVDLKDPAGARRGVIALQLHSGGKTEVRFRNLQLEVLEAKSSD